MSDTQLTPHLFPNLNPSVLESIAAHWVSDYREKDVNIERITIHPRGMPIFLKEVLPNGSDSRKYVVVFHCPDCTRDDLPSANDTAQEHLEKVMNNEFSPYYDLYAATTGSYRNDSILFYASFRDAYTTNPGKNWRHEWQFIMKYQGAVIPADVWKTTGLTLYPGQLPRDKPPESEPELSVDAVLIQLQPDVVRFYNALKRYMKPMGGVIHSTNEHAKNVFKVVQSDMVLLTLEDVETDYLGTAKPPRAIQGQILKRAIARLHPTFALREGLSNANALYDRFSEIKKDRKKD